MSHGVYFHGVSYRYDGQTAHLVSQLTTQFPRGWTGVVGANGVGKTTILKLAIHELSPTEGRISAPNDAIYCAQRTDDFPPDFSAFLGADNGQARMLQGRLKVEKDWLERWATLSHGERKRAQIGVAIWKDPKVLAIDEPTNHLDRDARRLLEDALARFSGVGILVSHDRELLDALCARCLFVEPPSTRLYSGGVTQGLAQLKRERETQVQQLHVAKRKRAQLERATKRYRNDASRADRNRSKRNLRPRDSDARDKINRARLTGKDGLAGKKLRQLDGRLQHARNRTQNLAANVGNDIPHGISIPGARLRRNLLLRLPANTLSIGGRSLDHSELTICPADRIAVTGQNGSGKSTLIRHLLESLGDDRDAVTYLPQEIDADASAEILDYARSLSGDLLGDVMTVVSRLGSDPERLLESRLPSPGEVRKLLLSLGIAQASAFLILDEPTNHLDLNSIECVEMALRDCACGLLLVSHDERILGNLTRIRWCLDADRSFHTQLRIQRD